MKEFIENLKNKYNIEKLFLPSNQDIENVIKQREKIESHGYNSYAIAGCGATIVSPAALLNHKPLIIDSIEESLIKKKTQYINNSTAIFAISRSGKTYETCYIVEHLIKEGFKENIYTICPSTDNNLFSIKEKYNLKHLEYPACTSGRFDILRTPSILPASLLGFDISIVKNSSSYLTTDIFSTAYSNAKNILANYEKGRRIMVFIYYSHIFKNALNWVKQMLAESLGKSGFSVTPIISDGVLDQHIQMQMFLSGYDDKHYQIFNLKNNGIASNMAHNIHKVMKKQVLDVTISDYESFEKEALVKFIIHWMLTIIIIGEMKSIDVFSQKSVTYLKDIGKRFFTERI